MKLVDFLKEAIGMSLQEMSRAVEDRTLWTSHIQKPRIRANSTECNTHRRQCQEKEP